MVWGRLALWLQSTVAHGRAGSAAFKFLAGTLLTALAASTGAAEPALSGKRFTDRFARVMAADPGERTVLTGAESVEQVRIVVNKSKTFRLSRPFSTVTVGNGEIAEAMPMSDKVLYVQGKKIGTTNVSIFDNSAQLVSVIDIDVTPD